MLDVVLTSPAHGALRHRPAPARRAAARRWPGPTCPRGGQATAHVSFVPTARGLHDVPTLTRRDALPARPVPRLDGLAAGGAAAGLSGARDRCRRRCPRRGRSPAAPTAARGAAKAARSTACAPTGAAIRSSWWSWKKAAQALETGRAGQPRHQRLGAPGALARLAARARRSPPRSACRAWPPGRWRPTAPAPTTACACPASRSQPGERRRAAPRCLEALALWRCMSARRCATSLPAALARLAAPAARGARHAVPARRDRLDRAAARRAPAAVVHAR